MDHQYWVLLIPMREEIEFKSVEEKKHQDTLKIDIHYLFRNSTEFIPLSIVDTLLASDHTSVDYAITFQ